MDFVSSRQGIADEERVGCCSEVGHRKRAAFAKTPLARNTGLAISAGDSVPELEKRAFDCEEENGGGGVNAELDADQGRDGSESDAVVRAKFGDEMHDEFLNEIGAIRNAGDEGRAGNGDATKW